MAESGLSAVRRCKLSLNTFLSLKPPGEAACGCAQMGRSTLGASRTVGTPGHPADPLGSFAKAPVPRWIQSPHPSAYEVSPPFQAECGFVWSEQSNMKGQK